MYRNATEFGRGIRFSATVGGETESAARPALASPQCKSIPRAAASPSMTFLSWRDPHTPAPREIIAQLPFDRLFRNHRAPVSIYENPADPAVLNSLRRDDLSVLDLVMEDARAVKRQRSSADRVRYAGRRPRQRGGSRPS